MTRRRRTSINRFSFMPVVAFGLAACTVGPDYQKPATPDVAAYIPAAPAQTAGTPETRTGEVQRFTSADIPGDWWTLFQSRALNELIARALKASPDIQAARAALRAAHENTLAGKGAALPQISAAFSASRAKTSAQLSPTPDSGALYYALFTPQVSVSYAPDVFGLNRRNIEILQTAESQARLELAAAHIALSANIAISAVQVASLRAQIAATQELIAVNSAVRDITRQQVEKGYVGRLDLAAQDAQLAQLTAALPPLRKSLAQQEDRLSILSGGFPGAGLAETFDLSGFTLPADIPLSLPSRLVEQRPDVRQAAENLHAASARIGVAVANRLPNIMLTADAGAMSVAMSSVFGAGAGFWSLAGAVTQPIFQGGTLLHQERAARELYTQAAAQYRGTVLNAFQDVADCLTALVQDADALKSAAASKQAAAQTLQLAEAQFKAGYAGYLALLNAQQAYQQAVVALIQAQAERLADTAALFQALGGGWWNIADLSGTASD